MTLLYTSSTPLRTHFFYGHTSVDREALNTAVGARVACDGGAAAAKQGGQVLGRVLQRALPRVKIDVHHAKALAEALGPAQSAMGDVLLLLPALQEALNMAWLPGTCMGAVLESSSF